MLFLLFAAGPVLLRRPALHLCRDEQQLQEIRREDAERARADRLRLGQVQGHAFELESEPPSLGRFLGAPGDENRR